MYSKVYWISCDPEHVDGLMQHYDSVVKPAIQSSQHHVGHHMMEAGDGKWLLVSNYHDHAAATAATDMVQQIVNPMAEQFGMMLDPVAEGEVLHSF